MHLPATRRHDDDEAFALAQIQPIQLGCCGAVSRWDVGIGTCINTNMSHLRRLASSGKPEPGGGWVLSLIHI